MLFVLVGEIITLRVAISTVAIWTNKAPRNRKTGAMASVRKEIVTTARADDVWAAIRDVGALHTRLVPGFVTDTKMEGSVRVVTFGNGMVLREPIVSIGLG